MDEEADRSRTYRKKENELKVKDLWVSVLRSLNFPMRARSLQHQQLTIIDRYRALV